MVHMHSHEEENILKEKLKITKDKLSLLERILSEKITLVAAVEELLEEERAQSKELEDFRNVVRRWGYCDPIELDYYDDL